MDIELKDRMGDAQSESGWLLVFHVLIVSSPPVLVRRLFFFGHEIAG